VAAARHTEEGPTGNRLRLRAVALALLRRTGSQTFYSRLDDDNNNDGTIVVCWCLRMKRTITAFADVVRKEGRTMCILVVVVEGYLSRAAEICNLVRQRMV